MASKTIKVTIKQRYDTEANWITNNPVLASGEVAFSSDKSCDYKVGDGTKTWSQLDYQNASLYSSVLSAASEYSEKAKNDYLDQQIDSTYIKTLSASGNTITYTKGDGTTTGTITVDGTGSDFTGATALEDGTSGRVIKPVAGKQNSFLKGDGTWSEIAGSDIKSGTIDDARLTSITTSSTTSAASPSHGGTFTAIDGITTDTKGRVTAVNTKTVTLPSNDNQNAFGNVKVGETTIAADEATDTLELAAGTNITLTPNASDDKVTIAATDTDRYVNSAAFADDTTASASSPIKMTLTRAGSDSATVTGNIPKVSDSSAGVAPKGAAVTAQDQSTKFLREDGSWAVPSYTTDTDRYVDSAAFTDDSTNGNVKMTLTRAGSDNATVIANIPAVSSNSAGVAPKGSSVSTQSQSTKFLREDGTWAAPSYTTDTNTTYSFTGAVDGITVTPSDGSATTYEVTSISASKITGVLDISNIPAAALERVVVVANDTARFALTTDDVQLGDTVKVTATKKMYMVKDTSNLDSDAGYEEYVTTADWSTITNKPNSYTPSSHTHTKSDITDFTHTHTKSDITDFSHSHDTVSSSSAGFAPKGADVSSQDQSTKFLREDGTWATPSYTTDTNTWRPIQVEGIDKLTDSSTKINFTGSGATSVSYSDGTIAISSTDNDRYVNTAAFAHDSTNDNVKMTLTRAGSDSATVVANIPKVSDSSSGVVPKGASVSTQSQSTKFLREDGTWAAPSYTVDNDTKNTAGSTDTSNKIFIIGATSQDVNPQTYSHDTAYVGTDGCLYSNNTKVSVEGHTHSYAGSSSAGGDATVAAAVRDNYDPTKTITIEYASSGISTANWFPAFDGYSIKPMSKANLASIIGSSLTIDGGTD